MSIIVFVLSFVLFAAGLFSGYMSLDLVPTGPGLVYALAGAVGVVGAVVVFALGVLAVRVGGVTRALSERAAAVASLAAASQARAWGVVLAVDAARDPVPPGAVAYVRLRSLGETRSFGAVALERVVRSVGERREVFAVIETDSAMVEAKRLRSLAKAKRSTKLGGGGRLVRPRAGIVVRDDEQE